MRSRIDAPAKGSASTFHIAPFPIGFYVEADTVPPGRFAGQIANPWNIATVTPIFSICIITRNRPEMLERSLASALAQTHAAFEVVVVDDGSTVPQTETVRVLLGDARIRFIRLESWRGRGAARAAAAQAATGSWVIWLDDDDSLTPGHLASLDRALTGREARLYSLPTVTVLPNGSRTLVPRAETYTSQDFANYGAEFVETTLTGTRKPKRFPPLVAQVAPAATYRDIAFCTDPDAPQGRTLEDVDWLARYFSRHGRAEPLEIPEPGYIVYLSGPQHRFEQPDEGERRLAALDAIFADHAAFFAHHCADAAYERACRRYLLGSNIFRRFGDRRRMWQVRAECAAIGGPLLDLFLADIDRQAETRARKILQKEDGKTSPRPRMRQVLAGNPAGQGQDDDP